MAATRDGGFSTFLLEMALDRRRMKARLAAVLIEERTRRGGGDARRFPQPKMAELLGYSLRQYQRLEDPDDDSLPQWDDLDRVLGRLDRPISDVVSEEPEPAPPELELLPAPAPVSDERLREIVREELAEIRGLVERVAAALEEEARATHHQAG